MWKAESAQLLGRPTGGGAEMAKIVMEVAADQFAFAPLLIILLLAVVALVTVVFLLRYRKGRK
jgi:hypothetical protein